MNNMATLFKRIKDTLNAQKEKNGESFNQIPQSPTPIASPVAPMGALKTADMEVDQKKDQDIGKIGTITPTAPPVAPNQTQQQNIPQNPPRAFNPNNPQKSQTKPAQSNLLFNKPVSFSSIKKFVRPR